MPEYVEAPEPDEKLLEAAADADDLEPTDDDTLDGTQLPVDEEPDFVEEGDAGVNDTGDEPWYQDGDA